MKRIAIPALALGAALLFPRPAPAAAPPRPAWAPVLQKIIDRRPVTQSEVEALAGMVFVLKETRPPAAPEGGGRGGERITVFRVEKGAGESAAFSRGQELFFESQRTMMRVLGAIAERQEGLAAQVVRQENLNRELLLGIRALGFGLDALRTDVPGMVNPAVRNPGGF